MAFSLNHNTLVITIPQSDLTFVSGTLYTHDTEAFRLELKDYEDSEVGMPILDTHRHNTEVTVAGLTYARFIEIINGYTIEYEDGQYAVSLEGSNNNIFEEGVIVRNQVSVISNNSAGLIVTTTPGSGPPEAHIAASYNGTDVTLLAWLTRDGATINTGLVSAVVNWHNPDGTILFSSNTVSFDTSGVALMTSTTTLLPSTSYYASVNVTDGIGSVADIRGVPTGE